MQTNQITPAVVSLDFERAVRRPLRADARQRAPEQRPGTVASAWVVWQQAGYERRYKRRTVAQYRRAVELWGEARRAGAVPEQPSSGEQVEIWLHWLRAQGLSEDTCNAYLRYVASVSRAAARVTSLHAAHVLADAIASAKRLRAPTRRPRVPPRDTLSRLEEMCTTPVELVIVRLCAVASLRIGEVQGLQVEDFDGERWTLTVRRTRGSDRRKSGRDHFVELDDKTACALAWCVSHRHELMSRFGAPGDETRAALIPWGKARYEALLARLRTGAPAAFPRGTGWHGLRHLGAMAVYERTGAIPAVQAHLGHATPVAAQTYMAPTRGVTSCSLEDVSRTLAGVRDTEPVTGLGVRAHSNPGLVTVTTPIHGKGKRK